jgi:pre-peptidase
MRLKHLLLLTMCAALVVSCVEQLVAPSRTGSISLRLARSSSPSGTCAAALPTGAGHLDAARLVVFGGSTDSIELTPDATNSSFSGKLDGLDPGTYVVALKGLVSNQVDYYGDTSGVQVRSGENTVATVGFCSFRPVIADLGLPTESHSFIVRWSRAAKADHYILEQSTNPGVPTSWVDHIVTDTSTLVTVTDTGTYTFRVLAVNASVPLGRPSIYDSIWVANFPPAGHKVWSGRWGGTLTTWSDLGNWLPPAVPTATDTVEVSPAANQPTLGGTTTVSQLTVRAGAILNTAGDTLIISGDLDASGSITGSGLVIMSGASNTLRGSVPNLSVTGTIGLNGNTIAAGNVTVSAAGALNTNGDTIRVSGDLDANAPINRPGLVVLTGFGKAVHGTVPDLQIDGAASLSAGLTVMGDLAIVGNGSKVTLNGNALADSGDLNLVDGALVLNNATDFLQVRNLNVSGPRNDTLSNGVMLIGGDVHETCNALPCARSFYTGGSFEFQFDYHGAARSQNIVLDDPTAWWFSNVRFTGAPDSVTFRTNARVVGDVVIPGDNVVYSEPTDTVFLCGNVDPVSVGSWLPAKTVLCKTPVGLKDSVAGLFATFARVNLHWVDSSVNEDGFQIERCQGIGCSTFTQIGTTVANDTIFGDSLPLATVYSYRVRAHSAVGVSAYSDTAGGMTPILLQNGQTVDVTAATGTQVQYAIQVPAGQTQLTVNTVFGTQNPGSGNADLYVRFGSQPTLTSWLCRPMSPFNSEQCTVPTPAAGDWYIMINAVAGFSNVSLTATY